MQKTSTANETESLIPFLTPKKRKTKRCQKNSSLPRHNLLSLKRRPSLTNLSRDDGTVALETGVTVSNAAFWTCDFKGVAQPQNSSSFKRSEKKISQGFPFQSEMLVIFQFFSQRKYVVFLVVVLGAIKHCNKLPNKKTSINIHQHPSTSILSNIHRIHCSHSTSIISPPALVKRDLAWPLDFPPGPKIRLQQTPPVQPNKREH